MKRVYLFFICFISLIFLSCCSTSDRHNFYGKYKFEKVSYLSPLSSSTIDYVNKRMAGTTYIIEEDLFKIEFADSTVEISSPN